MDITRYRDPDGDSDDGSVSTEEIDRQLAEVIDAFPQDSVASLGAVEVAVASLDEHLKALSSFKATDCLLHEQSSDSWTAVSDDEVASLRTELRRTKQELATITNQLETAHRRLERADARAETHRRIAEARLLHAQTTGEFALESERRLRTSTVERTRDAWSKYIHNKE